MLARFSGPPEGIYTISPRHMATNKPINANDEDLKDGEEMIALPLDQPTCMSYFLQRMRLAEILRHFTDRVPLATSPETTSYDVILEIDGVLENFLNDCPPFFTMDANELQELPPIDPRRAPNVVVQRHVLNLFLHAQRLKLHLPYLARATVEPEYARSREVCLKAARFILYVENRLEHENGAFALTRLKLTVILHSVFLASIVLLMDLCSTSDAENKEATQQELTAAWRIMELAQTQSVPAARLMELLKGVMKKHKVPFPVVPRQDQLLSSVDGQEGALPLTPSSGMNQGLSSDATSFEPPYYGQNMENFAQRMELDDIDWDSLFWGLEAPFI